MKNVRIWFKKDNEARFISHLDLNRVIARAVKMSNLPVWYTQGFNPHPLIVFPLSLPLGFRGLRECMDVRLETDINEQEALSALNLCVPKGLEFFKITEPVMKAGEISYAKFKIEFTSDNIDVESLKESINKLITKDRIIVSKRSKSKIKDIDIKPYINAYEIVVKDDLVFLTIELPAGSSVNINPLLLVNALEKEVNEEIFYDITRVHLMNEHMEIFN